MTYWNTISREHKTLIWMTGIFVTCLLIADLTGAMLFSFRIPYFPEPILLSAGIIPFPVTFILTDLINEFYGQSGARFVTWVGFGMCFLCYLFLYVGNLLPIDERTFISKPVFMTISSQYTGMFVASITAYLVGQFLDISVFHWFKRITGNRLIWLRATGSTVISQFFDSIIVTFIAFWGQLQILDLFRLALGNYTWKFIIAVGITPILYLGHILLKQLFKRN